LPLVLAASPINTITAPISLTNLIVDLNSATVYSCSLTINDLPDDPASLSFDDRSVLSLFATLVCHIPTHVSISALFQRLPGNHESLLFFFQVLFETGLAIPPARSPPAALAPVLSATLEELEREFPSAGALSRTEAFGRIAATVQDPDCALRALQQQNCLALSLRAAIDDWVLRTAPDDFARFSLGFTVLAESVFASAPAVQCLREEVEANARAVCGGVIVAHIRHGGLIGASSLCLSDDERVDVAHFRAKLPPIAAPRSARRSSKSLSASLVLSRRVRASASSSEADEPG
jgi:hypothetical protein